LRGLRQRGPALWRWSSDRHDERNHYDDTFIRALVQDLTARVGSALAMIVVGLAGIYLGGRFPRSGALIARDGRGTGGHA